MSFDRAGVDHLSCDPDVSNFNIHPYACCSLYASQHLIARLDNARENASTANNYNADSWESTSVGCLNATASQLHLRP